MAGKFNLEIENKLQWHPAFCAAIELELRENKGCLVYSREYSLGKKPLQIDLLAIKKASGETIKNEIGDFFLGYNIMEYKAPNDALNIDTFYKVLAYACLYKADTGAADEVLDTDITVSLIREGKPIKLLKQLAEKYQIKKKGPGIYRVSGMLFPLQILVTKELDPASHVWLRSLTRSMGHEQAEELLNSSAGLEDVDDRKNASAVINLASDANNTLFVQIVKEGGFMSEALKELIEPELKRLRVMIANSETLLAGKDAALADKDAALADKDAALADKDAALAGKDAEIADKDAEIAFLKRQLSEIGRAE